MVKIENDYGDSYVGKSSNAIYQKFYGQQIRRKGYTETKEPSKAQIKQRNKFKDALAWVKTLTNDQIQALKTYYRNSKLAYTPGYPINWYNFAKLLYLKKPTFNVLDTSTNEYEINHPGIKKIEEKSSTGSTLYAIDDLSSFEEQRYTETYTHTPITNTSEIVLTTLSGLEYNYIVGEIADLLKFFDSKFFDSKFFE